MKFVNAANKVEPQEMTQDHDTSEKKLYAVVVRSCVDYVDEISATSAEEAESLGTHLEIPIEGDLVLSECWTGDDSTDKDCSFRWDNLETTNLSSKAELVSLEKQLQRQWIESVIGKVSDGGAP